mgnify:CR=1 FL=1
MGREQERIARGELGDPRGHLHHPHRPVPVEETRYGFIVELWSAVSVSVLLAAVAALVWFELAPWWVALLAGVSGYVVIESAFRRRLTQLTLVLTLVLAGIAAILLLWQFRVEAILPAAVACHRVVQAEEPFGRRVQVEVASPGVGHEDPDRDRLGEGAEPRLAHPERLLGPADRGEVNEPDLRPFVLRLAVHQRQPPARVDPHGGAVEAHVGHHRGVATEARSHRHDGLGVVGALQPARVVREGHRVGLGVALTSFSSLVQDYVRLHNFSPEGLPAGRHIAIAGDAELDEGNIYEALLEGWKHDIRNVWWIVDYNRQSLDSVVSDRLFQKIKDFFQAVGWNVVVLKYGKRLERAFAEPGGEALRRWIDDCPNDLYAALTYKGGSAWREHLEKDLGNTRFLKRLESSIEAFRRDDARFHLSVASAARPPVPAARRLLPTN